MEKYVKIILDRKLKDRTDQCMTARQFNLHEYPYPSKRTTTVAKSGMVATSRPLAAQAGLDILKKGGNAVDAAIATAAELTVVEPTSNGIGGDAFAIVWMKDEMYGLNASGPAPLNISIDQVKAAVFDEMPKYGMIPVTIPGIPSAWRELSDRFGNLSLEEVFEPAIEYAEEGYAISPTLGHFWDSGFKNFKKLLTDAMFKPWFDTFVPKGRAPKAGETWSSQDHANTLRAIAKSKAQSFYQGDLADQIVKFSDENSGYISKSDLANCQQEWVDPISVNYRGFDVWELPPNGQGVLSLLALNILKNFDLSDNESTDSYHKQIEAVKLAFSLIKSNITDLKYSTLEIDQLLSGEYGEEYSKIISEQALTPEQGKLPEGGTVYLETADKEGNMVSYIQSNYFGFGSGIVIPETGIALQNRGFDFSLDPVEPNALVGGKRSFHTIIPGFLTKNDQLIGPFGLMGGLMQPQGHLQLISNMIDFRLNPQTAIDAPRWQWTDDKNVLFELGFPKRIAGALNQRGHHVKYDMGAGTFGRAQVIWKDPATEAYFGGTDGRADGSVVGY